MLYWCLPLDASLHKGLDPMGFLCGRLCVFILLFTFLSSNCSDSGSGGGDFVAGFLLGGAIFGTLAYIFAPQIRRSLLNEDEYGFRKAKRPIYYDEGLERTRQTLNEKIGQLNSAIDNVSSRLRGGNNVPATPVESDPEVEATL
ncbi:uncharacterized protein LOC114721481 [Neltuma alba]|uniref:uncharacterized protein LOC114721481 n=1 Tax=Neltuma alba TaxID=207710 RepID=UPI0010A5319B|nr:uncharacterized protein LOC114721481 [Prosopis alba]